MPRNTRNGISYSFTAVTIVTLLYVECFPSVSHKYFGEWLKNVGRQTNQYSEYTSAPLLVPIYFGSAESGAKARMTK